ncbi:ACP S-malonyltransferase [Streptomyces griseiscabiei]|uniref:Malonyl CoA-acyl carrier protein transacylase n=1 Tax=Streptomyces griseiscabiei TaxID=2993540 RepID=A0ABU4LKT1_9ACTN|nr:malonate decarboxylase subunit epsilon [Streptomyces griseiscabiei]MBZ3900361.1 malonate decarboxylase subunit epsilon [Streptomyces griseiscabiei]MDX2916307.1 malonate decarboxylase subunit epsilon [Streptomyces griseiscabiei]
MSLAFLYPGQGSQRPGMLHALPTSPEVAETLGEAATALHRIGARDPDTLDTPEALRVTTYTQLALLIAGVAAARVLTEEHGLRPDLVAGHSVGAFAAAVTAGVLTFEEAIGAVHLRGELMRRVCADGQWGMAAVLGLGARDARTLTERVSTADDPLWVANVNAADQIVLSGTATALGRAESAAPGLGARRWKRLEVTVASHCPLQEPVAERLAGHLTGVPRRPQRVPYLTNVRGRRVREDAAAVLDDLARSVARPVRWYDATRVLAELGVTRAVQMPPGRVLARLMQAAAPGTRPIALDDAGIEQVLRTCSR